MERILHLNKLRQGDTRQMELIKQGIDGQGKEQNILDYLPDASKTLPRYKKNQITQASW